MSGIAEHPITGKTEGAQILGQKPFAPDLFSHFLFPLVPGSQGCAYFQGELEPSTDRLL